MHHLKIFVELTRLNKPIGFMLLFWPCSWGLSYAYLINQNTSLFTFYLVLFFFGSVLMRSAGCIVNDIIDRDFDKRVERTKKRPITSGKISVQKSLVYVLLLCATAFIILVQFNFLTITLGLGSMFLAFSYPFMKRFTYWPQLFLGITFNWGLLMGWSALLDGLSLEIVIMYFSAIFWTLGYDTIYGAQDMSDDEIIGLKSTSIKFKKNINLFVGMMYLTSLALLFYLFKNFIGINFFSFLLLLFVFSLLIQIFIFNIKNSESCLKMFKLNNVSGLILFLSILTLNY